MLLSGYRLEMSLPECNHFVATPNALVELAEDVGAVLPYLNAVLPGARYDPNVPALLFRHEGRRIVLRAHQAALSSVENEVEARRVMDALTALINHTWERRTEIEPSARAPVDLKLFDVYRLLPGGNCRACGEANCLAFAAKLMRHEAEVAACAPLFAPGQEEKCSQLLDMISDASR